MATALSDINFQSEIFGETLEMEFTHRVGLLSSGLIAPAGDVLVKPGQSGQFANVMKYNAISGPSVKIASGMTTSFKTVTDYKDIAVWIEREDAWDAETIIKLIAGKDPTMAVIRAISSYWGKDIHDTAYALLQGVFGSALLSSHSTGTEYTGDLISAPAVLGAKQLLGDNKDLLRLIVMHSKVHNDAVNQNLQVSTPRADDAFSTGDIQRILGLNPTITDLVTPVSDVYSSFLAVPGAVVYKTRPRPSAQMNNANIVRAGDIEIELYRNSINSGGIDGLITRISYLVHLPGVSYKMGTAPANPTNAQIATVGNWEKVVSDDKLIRIVELKTL